jgi:hypothetical protein
MTATRRRAAWRERLDGRPFLRAAGIVAALLAALFLATAQQRALQAFNARVPAAHALAWACLAWACLASGAVAPDAAAVAWLETRIYRDGAQACPALPTLAHREGGAQPM